MSRHKLLLARTAFCLVLLGQFTKDVRAQAKPSGSSDQATTQQMRRQLENLLKEVSDLRKETETLKSRLDFADYSLSTKQTKSDSISLDLTSRNYQRLDTDNGFFLVSVEEALPYLNGYKIQLKVGNPLNATYKDYTLKVKWSKPYDWNKYTQASYEEWNKAIQEKDIPFPQSLEAGAWNSVEVILAPVTAEQLGYVTVSMDASTVSLRTR